jgi:SWI/SNF related-matrix-associated actin-dependent regulator of chromatin subfamily C
MIQFQDTTLGAGGSDRSILRIPAEVFLDFQATGALVTAVQTIAQFKTSKALQFAQFDEIATADLKLELVAAIRAALVGVGRIITPRVHFTPTVQGPVLETLTQIATKLQFEITDQASATHVVSPPATSTGHGAAMIAGAVGSQSQVHWKGRPDSFDRFHGASDVADLANGQMFVQQPFHVAGNWLADSAKFNELMNVADYVVQATDALANAEDFITSITEPATLEVNAVARTAGKRKREDGPEEQNHTQLAPLHNPEREPKVTRIDQGDPKTVRKGVRTDMSGLDGPMASPFNPEEVRGSMGIEGNEMSKEKVGEEPGKKRVEEQLYHIITPSTAAWFKYDGLDSIESTALPEFFSDQKEPGKTPEMYLAYRNFMIDTYRLNPTQYLTVSACRRNLVGDVCAVIRVHAFLEQWGLINYQVDMESRPTPYGPPSSSHFLMLAETKNGVAPVHTISASDETVNSKTHKFTTEPQTYTLPTKHGLHNDVYLNTESAAPTDEDWTDQETLYLLEGIDLYKENWSKVSDHVNQYQYGGQPVRSHDDCVLQFVRLPIEDPYLSLEPHATTVGKSATESYPLKAASNPLMATLAFLSKAVDPTVAAAGAKSVLAEMGNPESEAAAADGEKVDKEKLESLSHVVLDAAGKKASLLAKTEEERLKALIATLVQTQLQKLELKLRHFETIELQLQRDVEKCAQERSELLGDRLKFQEKVANVKATLFEKEQELKTASMDYGEPVVERMLGGEQTGGGAAAAAGF